VISEEPERVVLPLNDGLAKQNERPRNGCDFGRFPVFPDSPEGTPSVLRRRAFQKAVLREFVDVESADFAVRRDAHDLKPGANWEALVECQPD
jgi:hypothetical protein